MTLPHPVAHISKRRPKVKGARRRTNRMSDDDDATEIQALFAKLTKRASTSAPVVDAIEADFKTMCAGGTAEQKSRKAERAEITAELAELRKELRKCQNVKNVKRVAVNQKRATRRRRLKYKISALRFRLADIQIEVENET